MKDITKKIEIKAENLDSSSENILERDEKIEEYLSETNSGKQEPVFIPTEGQYRPSTLVRFLGCIIKLAVVFLVGGIGGVWMEHNAIPVLATKPPFDRYEFFQKIKDRTTIINRTEEIKISEDAAGLEMVRKTNPSIVKITANYTFQEKQPARGKKKTVLAEAVENRSLNGVIITSDGLIMTYDPKVFSTDQSKFDFKSVTYKVNYGGKEYMVTNGNDIKPYDAKSDSSDPRAKLVLLNINAINLPVIALASVNNVEVGQKVFALGNNLFSGVVSSIEDGGAVKLISMDNNPSATYFGSGPLVNIRGELLGINMADAEGKPTSRFISIDGLKDFINSAIGL